jgi:hypothetical protein
MNLYSTFVINTLVVYKWDGKEDADSIVSITTDLKSQHSLPVGKDKEKLMSLPRAKAFIREIDPHKSESIIKVASRFPPLETFKYGRISPQFDRRQEIVSSTMLLYRYNILIRDFKFPPGLIQTQGARRFFRDELKEYPLTGIIQRRNKITVVLMIYGVKRDLDLVNKLLTISEFWNATDIIFEPFDLVRRKILEPIRDVTKKKFKSKDSPDGSNFSFAS